MEKRILCILGKLRAGGVESIMYSYYRSMNKSEYQYDFVYEDGSDFDVPAEILALGAKSFKVHSIGNPFAYIRDIAKIINKGGYTIVHSNMNSLSLFSLFAALICRVKYRILHNHTTSSPVEKKRTLIKKCLRPFNLILKNVSCACSDLAARWMYGNSAFEKEKVIVLRNGVCVDKYKYSADARAKIRNEFSLFDEKVIGHVGRFATTKNHRFIIDMFCEYIKIENNAVLMLVGDGELFAETKEYADVRGVSDKIIFTGVRNDVGDIFCAFDVFVLPSLYEGLPIVAMEALSSGLPVFLSDRITSECGIDERVKFLPIDSAEEWAVSISNCAEYSREEGYNIMKNGPYDIDVCVKELEKLYAECK